MNPANFPQALLDQLTALLAANPELGAWYTAIVRFVFPVLALLILIRTIRSLLTVPHVPEVWAYLTLPNGASEPLTHWENILGRAGASDVVLGYPTVSRQHAALIRAEDDSWTVYDLDSKGGVAVIGLRSGAQFVPVYVEGHKRLFHRTRIIFGEAYRPEATSRRPSPEEVQAIADEVLRRAYDLGRETL